MEFLILGVLVFFAALALAPEGAVQLALVAVWGLGALAVLAAVARWLFG